MSDASVKSQGTKPEEKPRNEAGKVQPSGEKKKLSKQEKREMRLAKQKEQKAQGGQNQGSSNQEKITEGMQKSKADLKAERRAKQVC